MATRDLNEETDRPAQTNSDVAGAVAPSICESLLLALTDAKFVAGKDAHGLLSDAAETHRNAIPTSEDPELHRAAADLLERIMNGQNSAWQL
jgi:hypothetical protein